MADELRTVEVHIQVTPKLNAKIDALVKENGGTRSEVWRRALALYDVAMHLRPGHRVAIVDRKGKVVTEIAGLM